MAGVRAQDDSPGAGAAGSGKRSLCCQAVKTALASPRRTALLGKSPLNLFTNDQLYAALAASCVSRFSKAQARSDPVMHTRVFSATDQVWCEHQRLCASFLMLS